MDEVASIVIVVVALFVGLALLGWACGDFERPAGSAARKPSPPSPPA